MPWGYIGEVQAFFGTSGFSYPEWRGSFYPERLDPGEMLGFYAGQLPTVELNNSFYRMPRPPQVASWVASVPREFRFALKAPRRITHIKKLRDVDDTLAALAGVSQLFGESLGTYGLEKTFGTAENLVRGSDGALLLGPTFANPIHRRLTDTRAEGSPIWDPVYPDLPVEFAENAAGLREITGDRPKVVYLQNATDPIVWWNWDLLWKKPQWLNGERDPDVTPDMHWYPGITFWQTTCDLMFANNVPTGHGHVYKSETVDAFAAIAPPPGWTVGDTVRLRALLDG